MTEDSVGRDESIAAEVKRRKIRLLCHATHPHNLRSIGVRGIVSREIVDRDGVSSVTNDQWRADGHRDCVSCSIEIPNVRFMRSVRPMESWAVVLLDPEPLARASTLFCRHNAALKSGQYVKAGYEAFTSLFGEAGSQRRHTRHPLNCPTNVQAEVLVRGHIDISLIRAVMVCSDNARAVHRNALEDLGARLRVPVRISEEMFDLDAIEECMKSGRLPAFRSVGW